MSLGEETVPLTARELDQVPMPIDGLMAASTGGTVQDLLMPSTERGRIREYTQIGDGMPVSQRPHSLLPMLDRARPQSAQRLVHKVSVVGCHVLRYVSRSRHENYYNLRSHISRLNSFNIIQPDRADSGPFQLRPSSSFFGLHSSYGDSALLRILNWKICLGMFCILAVQAVLKLAYQQLYNLRYPPK